MADAPARSPARGWPYVLGCGLAMGAADVVPRVSGGSLWKIWPFRTVLESTINAKGKLIVLREALAAPPSLVSLLLALLLAAIGVVLVVGLEQLQERPGMAEMGG